MKALALLLAFGVSPAAMAQQTFVAQRVEPPPEVVDGLRRVVIAKERGPLSQAGVEVLIQQLRTKIGFNSAPVADEGLRSDVIDFVIVEHPGGLLGNDQIAAITQKHDAQAVVTFTATGDMRVDETFQGKDARQRTNEETGETEVYEVNVPCQRRAVELNVNGAVITADGVQRVTWQRSVRDDREDCDRDDAGPDTIDLPPAGQMLRGLASSQASAFSERWLPAWRTFQVFLPMDAVTRDAVKMVTTGNWSGAAAESARILADDTYNAQATMVAAAVLELHGRAADAEPLWAMANRLRPNKIAVDAQGRASARVAQLAALERGYGQKPSPWPQPSLDPIVERAHKARAAVLVGQPASIKGSRNKRHPVYASPDAGSMVLTTLPGNAQVRHIRVQGKFAEIQLPDGATGWVLTKSVKR